MHSKVRNSTLSNSLKACCFLFSVFNVQDAVQTVSRDSSESLHIINYDMHTSFLLYF